MKLNRFLSPDVAESAAPVAEAAPALPASQDPKKSGIASLRAQLSAIAPAPEAPTPSAPEPIAPPAKPISTPDKSTPKEANTSKEPSTKPGTTPVDEVEDFTKNLTSKSQARFNELANKRGEAIAAEKLKAAKLLTPELEAEFESHKKTNAELLAELRQFGIERSPEYKAKFVERPAQIKTALSEIAKTYELPEGEIMAAVQARDRKKLNGLLESVGIIDRNEAAQLVLELQKIEADRAAVTKDPETAIKLLQEERDKEVKAHVEKLRTDRREALTKEIVPLVLDKECSELGLFEGEQGEALKADLSKSITGLNDIDLESMAPKDRAAMVASALVSKPLSIALKSAQARIVELEGRLSQYDSVKPSLGGRAPVKTPTDKPKSFLERAKAGEI